MESSKFCNVWFHTIATSTDFLKKFKCARFAATVANVAGLGVPVPTYALF
jgi:hypothetical protein